MKHKIRLSELLVLLVLMFSLSDLATASDSVAYYSDNQNDRVVAFDPVEMSIRAVLPTKGTRPYPIGKANDKTTYVTTRDSYSIDVLNNFDVINGCITCALEVTGRQQELRFGELVSTVKLRQCTAIFHAVHMSHAGTIAKRFQDCIVERVCGLTSTPNVYGLPTKKLFLH